MTKITRKVKAKKYYVYRINNDAGNPVMEKLYEVIDNKPPKVGGNGYVQEIEYVNGKYEMTLDEFCRLAKKVED